MALQVWLHGKDLINRGLCSNNATWTGPATYADGKLGKCYSCTSSHHISYAYDFASTDKFTITFWIYIPTSLSTCNRWEEVFHLQDYLINWADYNALKIYDNSYNQLWWLDGNIFYDKWIHLTIAHNTDTITLYINGDHYDTGTSTSSPISSGTIYAGRGITDEHGPVKFNDIRLYDHCLSPKEVKEISKGLVLHYPLNDAACSKNLASNTDWERTSSNEYMRILDGYQDAGTGEYTFSCEMKVAAGTPSVCIYSTDESYTSKYAYSVSDIYTNGVLNGKLSQQWQKVVCKLTFTVSTEDSTIMPHISTYYTYGSGAIVSVRNPKLEKGWNPNPIYTNSLYNTVYDCSGYQNNGTISGALSCSTDSPRYNKSCKFGSGIIGTISGFASAQSYIFWANVIDKTIQILFVDGVSKLGFGIWNPYFICSTTGKTSARYSIDNLTTGWHHFAVVNDLLYIDGVLQTKSSGTDTWTYSSSILEIGNRSSGTSYPWKGQISDFRIYATALSAEDIKELYNTSAYVSDNGALLTYSAEE